MKDKKILALMVVALLLIVSGVTYAAFTANQESGINTITTGQISMSYTEPSNALEISKAIPVSDTEGLGQSKSFEFSVTSHAKTDADDNIGVIVPYEINVTPLTVTNGYTKLDEAQIKVGLTTYEEEQLTVSTIDELKDSTQRQGAKRVYTKTNVFKNNAESITEKYKLRLWIADTTDQKVLNEKDYEYRLRVNVDSNVNVVDGTVIQNPGDPNIPDLGSNMIAVYYDATSKVWRKADSANANNNWYDYDAKKWANAVTVKEVGSATSLTLVNNTTQGCSGNCTRTDYKNAPVGTVIPMDDINTMMVWIPRYSYEVFNYNANGDSYSSPQEINIEFEIGLNESSEILCVDNIQGSSGDGTSEVCKTNGVVCTNETCNGKMYTHPAFCFGDKNSDGTCPEANRLEGLWVSKFELSGTIESITLIASITAKPGLQSLVGLDISSFSTNIMKMNDSGNAYGFLETEDTHMMKNMEWGAVAYLSHSKYGTCTNGSCTDVKNNAYRSDPHGGRAIASSTSVSLNSLSKEVEKTINNSKINSIYFLADTDISIGVIEFKTGCGPISATSTDYGATCNEYNSDLGLLASTTQNVYGVYDMAGGAYDYVMGNVAYSSTQMLSSYSGFAGVNTSGASQTGKAYPASKYYDRYSYGTSSINAAALKRMKLGDSTKEVAINVNSNWYSDDGYVANSNLSWFERGGNAIDGSLTGVFYSNCSLGSNSYDNRSTRFVIAH